MQAIPLLQRPELVQERLLICSTSRDTEHTQDVLLGASADMCVICAANTLSCIPCGRAAASLHSNRPAKARAVEPSGRVQRTATYPLLAANCAQVWVQPPRLLEHCFGLPESWGTAHSVH